MALTQVLNHAARARALLISQYRKLTRWSALLAGIGGLTQEVEDAAWGLVAQLHVDTATGIWLDFLGARVGQARQGQTNDIDYRQNILARIQANKSRGIVEDIIAVHDAWAGVGGNTQGPFRVKERPDASITMDWEDLMDGAAQVAEQIAFLVPLLRDARPAGVATSLTFRLTPYDSTFLFAPIGSTAQVVDPDHGFGVVPAVTLEHLTALNDFDDVAWLKEGRDGPVAPNVTANAVLAPDGISMTADQIDYPAVTTGTEASWVRQNFTLPFGRHNERWSVWLRADAPASVWIVRESPAVGYHFTEAALTTSWQEFSLADSDMAGLERNVYIGVDLAYPPQSAQPAQTIYAWGASYTTGSNTEAGGHLSGARRP